MRQPSQQQAQLNQAIEQVRGMMQQVKNAPNPEQMLAQLLQNNPNTAMIANLLKSNGDLHSLAQQMAQSGGFDLNAIVNALQGGM